MAARELHDYARRTRRGAPGAVVRELAELERRRGRVEELATRGTRDAVVRLDDRHRAVVAAGTRLTRGEARRLDGAEACLRALDPQRVLERGYSITRDGGGAVLRGVDALAPGDPLHTRFAVGEATSRVETVTGAVEEDEEKEEDG
jgi:exonuclease VII large subunit